MKKAPLIIGILLAVLSLVCVIALLIHSGIVKIEMPDNIFSTTAEAGPEDSSTTGTGENGNTAEAETVTQYVPATDAAGNYKTPVDFERVWESNTDMYAWIKIPGTRIDYPIAQSAIDDNQYLRHDLNGKFSNDGVLFTEHVYNSKSFDDPVTVIYGHNMIDGDMFGTLQQIYSDETTFRQMDDIIIYTPEKEIRYKVIAAAPYDNTHILYHYGKFENPESVGEFLKTVQHSRDFSVNVRDDIEVGNSDRILVLSTCLKGDYSRRYLVLAKKI